MFDMQKTTFRSVKYHGKPLTTSKIIAKVYIFKMEPDRQCFMILITKRITNIVTGLREESS